MFATQRIQIVSFRPLVNEVMVLTVNTQNTVWAKCKCSWKLKLVVHPVTIVL